MPTSQLWRLRLTGTTRVRSPDLGKDAPESLAPTPLRTGAQTPHTVGPSGFVVACDPPRT